MKYWKVASGRGAYYWEEFVSNDIIFYTVDWVKDCNSYENTEKIIEIGKKGYGENYAKDLVLFYKTFNKGDKIILYGKKSIIAIGEIISDYEYNTQYSFPHTRRVRWKNIYGLKLFRSEFLPPEIERKLRTVTTFLNLTKREWDEINQFKPEGKTFPLSIEKDIQLHIAANLNDIKQGLKLYSHEYPIYDEKTDSLKRIDVLAYDSNNNLYVIETKRGEANMNSLYQTKHYVDLIAANFDNFKKIFGIIVAYSFKDDLIDEVKKTNNIILKKYKISFEFKDC